MSDEIERVARDVIEHSSDLSASADCISALLGTAVSAAAARAHATAAGQDCELVVRAVVLTLDREVQSPVGVIRARASPTGDPLGTSLNLAVQGIASVSVAVEIFDGDSTPVATATIEFSVRASNSRSKPHELRGAAGS